MYTHKVQYYETDKMGITHHSNYIRWMEEARLDYLSSIGYGYDRLESEGIISPVVSVECNYKKTTTFYDVVDIDVSVESYNGVKLVINYTMKNSDGATVCEAHSSHCFLNENGKPVRMSKEKPEFHEALMLSCK